MDSSIIAEIRLKLSRIYDIISELESLGVSEFGAIRFLKFKDRFLDFQLSILKSILRYERRNI